MKRGQSELIVTILLGVAVLVLFCIAFYYVWQLRIEGEVLNKTIVLSNST